MRGSVVKGVCLAVTAAMAGACQNSEKGSEKGSKAASQPVSMASTFINDVVPLPDGGAYAIAGDGGLWYLRGPEAVRVKDVERLTALPSSVQPTVERWALTLAAHERSGRRKAERQIADAEAAEAEAEKEAESRDDDYRP